MLPRLRVHFIPAGKAPQRGAAAVKASYLMASARAWPLRAAQGVAGDD
jgi:hypothetical protein